MTVTNKTPATDRFLFFFSWSLVVLDFVFHLHTLHEANKSKWKIKTRTERATLQVQFQVPRDRLKFKEPPRLMALSTRSFERSTRLYPSIHPSSSPYISSYSSISDLMKRSDEIPGQDIVVDEWGKDPPWMVSITTLRGHPKGQGRVGEGRGQPHHVIRGFYSPPRLACGTLWNLSPPTLLCPLVTYLNTADVLPLLSSKAAQRFSCHRHRVSFIIIWRRGGWLVC